jgi:hypothetical protein
MGGLISRGIRKIRSLLMLPDNFQVANDDFKVLIQEAHNDLKAEIQVVHDDLKIGRAHV